MTPSEKCVRARRAYEKELMSKYPDVVGVGCGEKISEGRRTGREAVIVLVRQKKDRAQLMTHEMVPSRLSAGVGEEIETDVIEVGHLRKQTGGRAFTLLHEAKYRPLIAGVSGGHPDITAGTIGLLVVKGSEVFILTNNHVAANCNEGALGDPFLQPGPYDGGVAADEVGYLDAFVPLFWGGQKNAVDAALVRIGTIDAGEPPAPPEAPSGPPEGGARPCWITRKFLNASNALGQSLNRPLRLAAVRASVDEIVQFTDDVLNLPVSVSGDLADTVAVGQALHKSGRTTGYTKGSVLAIDVTVDVDYSDYPSQDRWARFEGQIIADAMSAGGDSGSAVFNDDGDLVGLLFAGSEQTTILNPAAAVFGALKIGAIL